MKAVQYLQMFNIPCAFLKEETPCGQPAIGVYVSDDPQPRGVFVCAAHAEEAEEMADGPVFRQSIAEEPQVSDSHEPGCDLHHGGTVCSCSPWKED